MSELSPKAKQLLQAARVHSRPSATDRDRIWTALGDPPVAPDASQDDRTSRDDSIPEVSAPDIVPPHQGAESLRHAASIGTRAVVVAGAGMGIALVGALIWFATGESPTPPPSLATPIAPTGLEAADGASTNDATSGAAASPSAVPATTIVSPPASIGAVPTPTPASSNTGRDKAKDLAEEVAILSRATRALGAGHPAEAMRELDAHRNRFPKGVLTEERRAATAEARCALGQHEAAKAELRRLYRTSGESPQFLRVKRLCAARGVTIDGASSTD